MKIQIASDLHLEQLQHLHPGHRGVIPADADVLVLAGDIANRCNGPIPFDDWPVPIIYVHGNHEFYGDEYHAVRSQLSGAPKGPVNYLENEEIVLSGVRFLGCCLWTDYALDANPAGAMELAKKFMYDHSRIRFGDGLFEPEHALALHRQSRAWLAQKLDEPFAGKTVVVTHHAPHRNSIHPDYAGHPANAGFVTDLEALMGKAALWIHGHTHSSFSYQVNGTRVVANPCGYPQNKSVQDPAQLRFENAVFDPRLVVEI